MYSKFGFNMVLQTDKERARARVHIALGEGVESYKTHV